MIAANISKKLVKQGNSILGDGFYSTVHSSSHNRVVKIGFTVKDPWLTYVSLAANKFLNAPIVYKLHVDNKHNYYTAVMPRLSKYAGPKEVKEICVDYIKSYLADYETAKLLKPHVEVVKSVNSLLDLLDIIKENTTYFNFSENSFGTNTDYEDHSFSLDLHEDNFMQDSNGVLIINDPWANYATTAKRRSNV